MTRFEVTVEPRDPEQGGKTKRFVVNTGDQEEAFRYGTTATEIASCVAADFSDAGSVTVRRMGGGERAVVGRSS